MADGKRYYWLKLKRDFFKRHDIRIIEDMPNGKDYILFYLKLLCESVDHEGKLRFSERIPYSEQMLATITNTNVDIVRSAIQVFVNLGMMEMLDNGTYFMSEVEKMIGSETEWAEKKREYRLRQAEDNVQTTSLPEKTMSDKSKSIEKEKEKEEDIDIEPPYSGHPDEVTVFAYASNNLMGLSPTHYQELVSFTEDLPDDVIRFAIDEACAYNVRTWAYTKAILNNYVDNGVDTVEKAKALKEQQRGKPKSNKVGPNGVRIAAEELHDLDEVFGG